MTRLRAGVVLRPGAQACEVRLGEDTVSAGYAAPFASRAGELAPGHVVALAHVATGPVVVWRWFDAVVLSEQDGQVRLWEPAHGEVDATPRDPQQRRQPGTRACLSAGLPGAQWWVAGPADGHDVELAEVDAFYSEHGLWDAAPDG